MDKLDNHSKDLSYETYNANFSDIKPSLSRQQAKTEAERCLYCEDAPCISACPTSINIPSFIHRIATHNIDGAAQTILESNILGGSCARVCPTEVLCEQACVRNKAPECHPVSIGRLQRYATDNHTLQPHPFSRAADTGKSVAVVGAGPAGLACAHWLARQGHQITLLDTREKPGGLNEYGIAAYKLVNDFAQQEVQFVLEIGGINTKYNTRLGIDISLEELRSRYDAVFLGLGLSGSNRLNIAGEDAVGVNDAIKTIAQLRQEKQLNTIPVGDSIVVIGGGNTAIDIACQMKRLGAKEVTIAYRRGSEHMSATSHEQAFARDNGIRFLTWVQPHSLKTINGHIAAIKLECTALDDTGILKGSGNYICIETDQIYKAIGQHFLSDCFINSHETPALSHSRASPRIKTNEQYQTSLSNVWAGGDCIDRGEDLTVQAVEHGKQAARAIHRYLMEQDK